MLEERLRWCIVYSRWIDKRYSLSFKTIFPLLTLRKKKRIAATLNSIGIGKFTAKEIYEFGQKDLDTVATILKDKPYLFGEQPSSYDAISYSFLANLIDVPLECPLNTFARNYNNLSDYCRRMKSSYFNDLL